MCYIGQYVIINGSWTHGVCRSLMSRCCTSKFGKIYHPRNHSPSFLLHCFPCSPSKVENCPKFHVIDVTLCFGDLGEPVIFCNLEWIKEDHPTTTSTRHIRIFQLVSNPIEVCFGVHVLGLRLLQNPPPWNLAWEARRRHLLESDAWSWGWRGLDTCTCNWC